MHPSSGQRSVRLLAPREEEEEEEAFAAEALQYPRESFFFFSSAFIYLFAAFPSEELRVVLTLTCTLRGPVTVCDWECTLSKVELWQCGPRLRLSRSRALALSL